MRPSPFKPEATTTNHPFDGANFVRDTVGKLVWHKVFNRTLYADTDRSGVVYHANYLRYFELGRSCLMRDVGYPYKEVEDSGYVYPIIDLGVTYHSPLYYDDPMWIYTRPGEISRVKVAFNYIIAHAETNKIVCIGFTQHCAINQSGWPIAIDKKTVQLWKTFPK
ncbi:MAG: YbgC/FadM family acyl-CoA thioesterase [Deltaproteobacteria bacterium]|nr:YbgC/FadM family acyl-CoA thioesterase [Deltaproteobacteria bacterium]MCL5792699.1 YbgC/FadM family acyl-CoA thioesterase [Deltaproteobacteria bacterium]